MPGREDSSGSPAVRRERKRPPMPNMMRIALSIALLALASGCTEQSGPDAAAQGGGPPSASAAPAPADASAAKPTLAEARRGFVTNPGGQQPPGEPAPQPPPDVFRLIKYRSPVGELSAYLTPDPGDGQKHPAI